MNEQLSPFSPRDEAERLARTNQINEIITQWYGGFITEEVAFVQIRVIVENFYQQILAREKEVVGAFAQNNGFDSLTTDTKECRSQRWFDKTGRAFATGVPSKAGIVCAVVHEHIGMGAAHCNMQTVDIALIFLKASLKGEHFSGLTVENAIESVRLATQNALDEFALLAAYNGLPDHKTQVIIAGGGPLAVQYKEEMLRHMSIIIRNHSIFTDSWARGVQEVPVNHTFGETHGVIYGGANHPLYPTPQFYTLE